LWAQSAGGAYTEITNSSCTDVSGNVYVTGGFSSTTITFGTITLTNADSSGYSSDIFVVKYSPNGNILWAISFGSTLFESGIGITTDTNGNVYVTGSFGSAKINFGATTLTNIGSSDAFIVKFTSNGTLVWANSAGGIYADNGVGVSTDAIGNLYVVGKLGSPTITFGTTTLTNSGFTDIFIVKYSPDGAALWAKSEGGSSWDYSRSVSTDLNGSFYVTGEFESPVITFGTDTLSNLGGKDFYIAKYSADGNILWAKLAGGASDDYGLCLRTDVNGNVYVTGAFKSPNITFGTTTLTNTVNAGNNSADIFVVKYAPDGTISWANSAGGTSNDDGYGVSIDDNGNVYVTGSFISPIITFGTLTLNNVGSGDIFIVKYTSDGTFLMANAAGGPDYDTGISISFDASDNVYVTGYFHSPTITFGTITLTNASNSGNSPDFYIAKYSSLSTGLNEPLSNNQLHISPNPTNSSITLTMPSLKNSKVSITTLTGTEVGNYNTQNTSTQTIDISYLANGVYFVNLKSEYGGVVTKKIIKQ
jgi:hypothetical protein